MTFLLGLSPIGVVFLGGLLLMLAEAFGGPSRAQVAKAEAAGGAEVDVVDAGSGRGAELALGAAVVLFAGAVFSLAVWMVGPEKLPGLEVVQPYLIIDRFSLFFSFIVCLGGGLVSLLAGGYLPEHK